METNTVWKLLNDLSTKKGITEISINGPQTVFVEREGKLIQLAVELNPEDINDFVLDLENEKSKRVGLEYNSSPILNTNLKDGSRVNIIKPPFTQDLPAISIRKYLQEIRTFESSDGIFGLYGKWVDFFRACVRARANIIISGGTGSGKSTLLNLLLQEVPVEQRVITIEDTLELNFHLPNLVRLEAFSSGGSGIGMRELVINTLRMRPDRIIIGESRGEEFFDLLMAMNTGHDGSMSTIHANSGSECLQRMESLFLMSGFDVPQRAIKKQISTGVDFIFQIKRNNDGKRIISEIVELTGMEADNILLSSIAKFDEDEKSLKQTALTPSIIDRLTKDGGLDEGFFA
jgi:pilus assembly protein CpaF